VGHRDADLPDAGLAVDGAEIHPPHDLSIDLGDGDLPGLIVESAIGFVRFVLCGQGQARQRDEEELRR
jgi:hypothetical protein